MLSVAPPLLLILVLGAKMQWITARLVMQGLPLKHPSASATLAVLLLACAPLPFLGPVGYWTSLLALDALATSIGLADAWHVRFYGDVLSVADVAGVLQLRRVFRGLLALVHSTDFLAYIDVVVGLFLAPWLIRHAGNGTVNRAAFVGAVAIAGCIVAVPAIRRFRADPDEVFEYVFQRRQIVGTIGLLPYHVYDFFTWATYRYAARASNSEAVYLQVQELIAERRRNDCHRSPLFGAARD